MLGMFGVIENSTKDTNYDLVVFTTGISDENQFLLLSQIVRYSNVSLRFIKVCPHIYGYNFYIDSDITNEFEIFALDNYLMKNNYVDHLYIPYKFTPIKILA